MERVNSALKDSYGGRRSRACADGTRRLATAAGTAIIVQEAQRVIQCRSLKTAAGFPAEDGSAHLDDAALAVLERETARSRSARSRGNGIVDVVRARPINT